MHVRARVCYLPVCALELALAQHVATPTIVLNFRDQSQIMEFTKVLFHENLELYGVYD